MINNIIIINSHNKIGFRLSLMAKLAVNVARQIQLEEDKHLMDLLDFFAKQQLIHKIKKGLNHKRRVRKRVHK